MHRRIRDPRIGRIHRYSVSPHMVGHMRWPMFIYLFIIKVVQKQAPICQRIGHLCWYAVSQYRRHSIGISAIYGRCLFIYLFISY